MPDTRLNRTAVASFACIVVPLVGWILTLVLAPLALRQIRVRHELGRGLVIAAVWIVIAQVAFAIVSYVWLGQLFADG